MSWEVKQNKEKLNLVMFLERDQKMELLEKESLEFVNRR